MLVTEWSVRRTAGQKKNLTAEWVGGGPLRFLLLPPEYPDSTWNVCCLRRTDLLGIPGEENESTAVAPVMICEMTHRGPAYGQCFNHHPRRSWPATQRQHGNKMEIIEDDKLPSITAAGEECVPHPTD